MRIPMVISLPQVVSVPVSSADQVRNTGSAHLVRSHTSLPQVLELPQVESISVPNEIADAMKQARANHR